MRDLLRMDHINALPHPFLARFCGDRGWWPVNDFEVQTGMMRIDACGRLEVRHFGEVMEIRDGDDVTHDADTFYSDWLDRGPREPEDGRHAVEDTATQHQIEGYEPWERKQVRRS